MAAAAVALCSLAGCAPADDAPLAWLAGCWTDGGSVERWTLAEDGYLFGNNVTLGGDGKVRFFEQLRIEPGPAGPVYQAYPGGRGPTAFTMLEQGEHSITFANPAHDYPQQISYARDGNALSVRIALIDGARATGWSLRRCR